MSKFIKFPKIGQFRNVVSDIKHSARFEGLDDDGQPKYNNDKLPTIEFRGTVKVHGTNAAVVRSPEGEIYAQSRNNVVDSGHFNFVGFVKNNMESFEFLFSQIRSDNELNWDKHSIAIFGEWAGPGVQKGVAVSELPEKMFFIFGVKIAPEDENEDNYWVEYGHLTVPNDRIHNIYGPGIYRKEIDFSNPKMVINELIDITNDVEKECPVGKAFGISGVGEGVVWEANYKGSSYRFKVKGEKHSGSKVKKLASVDPEKLKNIQETVNYLVAEPRLDQAIQETNAELHRKHTGDVMRWLANDIRVEEADTLEANGLEWKDVASAVTGEYRRIFFQRIDENL